jgi:hypothetical protein
MHFKHDKDKERMFSLNALLIMIYADLYAYTKSRHNKELVITSTVSTEAEDKALNRVSDSHQHGLALDFSVRNLNDYEIEDIVDYINNKDAYRNYRYLSYSGAHRLAFYHDNSNGPHIHLAINKGYSNGKVKLK